MKTIDFTKADNCITDTLAELIEQRAQSQANVDYLDAMIEHLMIAHRRFDETVALLHQTPRGSLFTPPASAPVMPSGTRFNDRTRIHGGKLTDSVAQQKARPTFLQAADAVDEEAFLQAADAIHGTKE